MKILIPFIITVAVGCATHAQPQAEIIVSPSGLNQDAVIIAQAPEALPAPTSVPKPPSSPKPARAVAVKAEPGWGMAGVGKGSSRSTRTLVIPQGDFSPEKLADAEEDLNVMALILEKAADQRSDDKKAMGIDLLTGSSSGMKNLLIEGHGAIFFLKTKIALLPPPTPKKEESKTKESTTSEWDEARQQLYGPSDIEKHVHNAFRQATLSFNSSEEYDKDKVQRLKDSLTEALKSASNIRHLKGDQTVTVVVTSSTPSMYVHEVRNVIEREAGRGGEGGRGGGEGGRGGNRVYVGQSAPGDHIENRSASRLLIQAKKSDIDSFAKGKLTSDAFRDKAKIQIY